MSETIIFCFGLIATGSLLLGIAYTIIEYRRMAGPKYQDPEREIKLEAFVRKREHEESVRR